MQILFAGSLESFSWLLNYSIDITILICLIFIIRFIGKKRLPAWWSYSLWLMLLVRMSIPFEFENNMNISKIMPVSMNKGMFVSILPVKDVVMSGIESTITTATSAATTTDTPAIQGFNPPVDKVLLFLWVAGVMILGGYILTKIIRFWIFIKREPMIADKKTLDLLEKCKDRMNIHKAVGIIVTDKIKSPALFGYFYPRLLLPVGILDHCSQEKLSYVFMHEMGHLKRHDIAISCIMTFFQIIHWFNPFIWLAFYHMRVDQESACDASVLSRLRHHQSVEYANAIVGFLERYCQNRQLPSMAGILENKTQMKRRLAMIVNYKKLSKRMAAIAITSLITTGIFFYTLTCVASDSGVAADVNLPESDKVIISISKDGHIYFSMDGATNLRSLGEKLSDKYKLDLTEKELAGFSSQTKFGMPLSGMKQFLKLSKRQQKNTIQPGIPIETGDNELQDWLNFAMTVNPNARIFLKTDSAAYYSIMKKVTDSLQAAGINRFNMFTFGKTLLGFEKPHVMQIILPERQTTTDFNAPRYAVARYIAPVVVLETEEIMKDNTPMPAEVIKLVSEGPVIDVVSAPKVNENHVLSLVLSDHNTIYWYIGITNAQARETDYSETGIRNVVQEQSKLDEKLVILIKPVGNSTYQNSFDILNELAVSGIQRYVLSELDDIDKAIIQR